MNTIGKKAIYDKVVHLATKNDIIRRQSNKKEFIKNI